MNRRSLLLSLAGLAANLAAGPAWAADAEVTIDNFTFSPDTLTVPVGTTVTWLNRDDIPHTVVSAAKPVLFKSPAMDTDDRFSRRFDRPGTYPYFCSLHPHMQGQIVVQ